MNALAKPPPGAIETSPPKTASTETRATAKNQVLAITASRPPATRAPSMQPLLCLLSRRRNTQKRFHKTCKACINRVLGKELASRPQHVIPHTASRSRNALLRHKASHSLHIAMQQTAQYWKPGEVKPRAEEGGSGPRDASSSDHHSPTHDGGRDDRHRTGTEGRKENRGRASVGKRRDSSGGDSKKREQKGKGKDKHASGGAQKSPPASTGKPAVTGPSQGLLAMKVG